MRETEILKGLGIRVRVGNWWR